MPHAIAVHALTHQGAVNALVFSPDGQCLATASSDHTISIWEVASWHQMTSLVHQGPLSALTFSLDGQYLAAASEDGTTHIWQIASKEQVATLNHKESVNAVAFSPDGHYLATGSRDRTASLWEVPSGKQLAQLQHRFPARSVAFSPDGHSLVTASEDGVVGVWEVPSGKQLQNLKHEWMVGAVIFSPDGRYLVTSGGDRFARVWRMPDGRLLAQLSHVGNTGSTAFSPDGRYLATTGGAMVNVYEVGNWHQMTCLIKGYELHSVVFSPDGKYLASAGQGSTAELWEVTDQPQLAHLICKGVKAMAFTSNDQCLITVGDTVAERWDITRKERLTHFPFRTLPFGDIRLSAEGRYLAATSTGLWDTKSSQQIAGFMAKTVTFNSDGSYLATVRQTGDVMVAEIANGQSVSLSHKDAVNIIVFSPDGRYLATASYRPSDNWGRVSPVTVWELPHGHLIASLPQKELVDRVLFSSYGSYFAVTTPSGAMVWETSTQSQLINIPRQQVSISDLAFSLDERYLTIAGSSQIQIYEIPQKHFLEPLEHMGIRSVMFSPNGRYLASVSDGHNACVWELTTGHRLAYLGHNDRVSKIAFSPDSSYIATASWDNTVGIWESTTGLQLCRLNHDNKVTDVSFSPNGKYVMSLDWDDILRVWLWRPEDMIAEAHAHMPRNLTTDEWQTYLGNEPYRKTFEESL
jgi:WD40 repeat protein